ncbi:zinc metallopeptidase [bacterium]|nr:zinc metallopeptidase [bacterium]
MGFYNSYLILLPALILALYAQHKVKGTYRKYSKVASQRGWSGAQTARNLLDENGLSEIKIEKIPGTLTDHYDPRAKVLRLSAPIHDSSSLSALVIAAHETGHAIQDSRAYLPLRIRHAIFPATALGTNLAFPLFFIGFFFRNLAFLMNVGILFFSAAVIFQIVTLPVERNASKRALVLLKEGNYLGEEEISGASKVLSAAALTYLAATAMAVMQLLRLLILRQSR